MTAAGSNGFISSMTAHHILHLCLFHKVLLLKRKRTSPLNIWMILKL